MNNNRLRRVVIKLTGTLFDKESGTKLKSIIELVSRMYQDGVQPFIITGGGGVARGYINLARALGSEEATLDELGIMVSRVNAKVLISILTEFTYPVVPTNLEEVSYAATQGRIVVCGGMQPGQSTNAVASLIAEKIKAELYINASDVDGVYTSDPKHNKEARKLATVSTDELSKILSGDKGAAGTYELMDHVAMMIIKRSKIQTRIVNCSADSIQKAIEGQDIGTLVTHDS